MGRKINENVERKMYAESMGRCMNPDCRKELFTQSGDIIEKAHIQPYSKTKNNSYENLIVLCPSCHTDFDKNFAYKPEEVKNWKHIRELEFEKFFAKHFKSFDELNKEIKPLLQENKNIFENYFLEDQKNIWDLFEGKILSNNKKIKSILTNNLNLIQSHEHEEFSNLHLVQIYLTHIDEFEITRPKKEKARFVLFPEKINSLFGIKPIKDSLLPSTESLEALIIELINNGKFIDIKMGIDDPYLLIKEDKAIFRLFLSDTPRLRQYYDIYGCYRKANVRIGSLNFALKFINSREIDFSFIKETNLREIELENVKITFIYEYCLSKLELQNLSPKKNTVLVNLHNWNGSSCISKEAYELAKELKITLLTTDDFYKYINRLKNAKKHN